MKGVLGDDGIEGLEHLVDGLMELDLSTVASHNLLIDLFDNVLHGGLLRLADFTKSRRTQRICIFQQITSPPHKGHIVKSMPHPPAREISRSAALLKRRQCTVHMALSRCARW